jgi:EAL domain-containing protein (putative c-di-GMP-specific phosphodiesterase class I)/GGDEF domain-containing protein
LLSRLRTPAISSQGAAVPQILLCLDHAASRQLLLSRLRPYYAVTAGDPAALASAPIDLTVLDGPALARGYDRLFAWKAAASPTLAPVLLVADRHDLSHQAPSVWELIDSFITAPIDTEELLARIDLLLRTRADSLLRRQQLADLINYDQTTGLPSLVLLRERSIPALIPGQPAALVLIALDNLRLADGALGTELVNAGLRALATRLQAALPPDATLAALGRDELACLLPSVDTPAAAADIVARILDLVAQPLAVNRREFALATRAGVALAPTDGADLDALVARARTALATWSPPGSYRFVSETLHVQTRERLLLLARLRRAVEREEFVLHYQPQLDVARERVVGVEALVRWQPADGPLVRPGAFIPLAEESGLIAPIGAQVLRMACRQCRRWQDAGLPLRVAVNLSAGQLDDPTLPDLVASTLREAGADPALIELEVTESAAIDQGGAVVARLHALAELGVRLAIDDFGAGYASLSYLAQLPADTLKLDQSFVRGLPSDHTSRAITTAMIGLAHELGLRVTAEGVQAPLQAEFLQARGCDELQGYAISRPLPPEAVPARVLRARQVG